MSYSIEYYKEKDTDPMVFLQRFRCTTEPIGGGTEQDEEGELVSWDAAVAAIEIAMKQLGWHSASELPPEEGEYIAIDNGMPDVFRVDYLEPFGWCVEIMGAHEVVNVKWWCYPPKEE